MGDNTGHIPAPPPLRRALPRIAMRVAVVVAVAYLARLGFDWLNDTVMNLAGAGGATAMAGLLVTLLIGYAILLAMPFVPGIEIGIALLVMDGARVAPFVYTATVLGLWFAFLVGHLVSLDWLHRVFRDLHWMRACALITAIKMRPKQERLSALTERLPSWVAAPLVDWRYVTVALLINLPGNFAIGGGGGILLLAGITRLFHPAKMMATVALAVLPIPLVVWVFGSGWLG